MDFTFTVSQEELRRSARSFLADRFPFSRVAALADSRPGWDPASWREFAQLGWLGVTLPEHEGGAGLSFVEQAILLEELGRALVPGPYFATVALALPALPGDERVRVAAGDARWSAELSGLVPDLDRVDRVVTHEGAALAAGDVLETLDPTRPLGRLAPGPRTPLTGGVDLARAFAGLAAEAVGVAARALELAVEHATDRIQFGRPIGMYQAVAHPLTDSYPDIELSTSLAYWAAWCVDEDPSQATVAAAAAKAFAAEAAVAACERAIQVHGGSGFTWEHPLQRYYRRAQWIEAFGGYPSAQHDAIAAALLDRADEAVVSG